MSNEYKEYLKKMDAGYKKSQKVYQDEFVLFPACISVFQLKSSAIGKRENGAHYIKSKWVIIDDESPDMKGRTFTDFQNLPDREGDTAKQFAFVRRWFHSMGFQAPESLTELPAMLTQLIGAGVQVKAQIKHNSGYANMTILGLLESDAESVEVVDATDDDNEEVVVAVDEQDGADEVVEADVDLLISTCEAAGLEFEVEKPDSVEAAVAYLNETYDIDYNDLEEGARDDACEILAALNVTVANYEVAEAKAKVTDVTDECEFLRSIANDLGADEDFADEDTENELVTKLNAYTWKRKELKEGGIDKKTIDKLIKLGVEIK